MKKLHYVIFLLAGLFLTSCSILSPVPTGTIKTYVIDKLPAVPHYSRHSQVILVTPPETNPVYDTSRMAYRLYPYQLAFYAKNSWAQTPSQMLFPLIVQSLQNSHYFYAVVTPLSLARYDYLLNTQILQLEQDYTGHGMRVRMVVSAQLIDMGTGNVVASKRFTAIEPMLCPNPYSGVIAANNATARILAQLVRFATRH